jgi:hypothetical protein
VDFDSFLDPMTPVIAPSSKAANQCRRDPFQHPGL